MNQIRKVKIEYAKMEDVPVILHIMDVAFKLIANPDWYCLDSEELVRAHIGEAGFTLKAVVDGEIAGFLSVRYPGTEEDNLGGYIGLGEEKKDLVAHMESAAVLPEYRGLRIQNRLMAEGFEILKNTEFKYVMGTAHPDNVFSVNNFLKLGYEIVADVEKYGGLRRYVFSKTI